VFTGDKDITGKVYICQSVQNVTIGGTATAGNELTVNLTYLDTFDTLVTTPVVYMVKASTIDANATDIATHLAVAINTQFSGVPFIATSSGTVVTITFNRKGAPTYCIFASFLAGSAHQSGRVVA
jgi:phage tail sheath gpL-like